MGWNKLDSNNNRTLRMKKNLLFLLFTIASFAAFGQSGSIAQTVYKSRVDGAAASRDTTDAVFTNAIATAIADGYGYMFWNQQATTPHWDFYTDAGVEHVFTFAGTGGSGGSFNHLTPNIQTGDYTATAADTITLIYMRHASVDQELTLPGAATIPVGRLVAVLKDSTNATVTIVGAASVDVIGTLTMTGVKELAVFHHRESGKWVRLSSGGGSVSDWGDIGGTLSDQTDLQAALDAKVNDTGSETIAGVKTFSSDPLIPDEAYDATAWNGSLEPPTKNAVRDKIETMAGTPAGANTNIQYNASGSFGAEAAFTYDASTNTADVDVITVDGEAYGAGWDSDNSVPTKNDTYDKIQTIVSTDYSRNAVATSAGTLTLNMSSLSLKNFDLTATEASPFTIAFTNTTNMVEAKLTLRLSTAVAITMPSGSEMQGYETTNARWNGSTNVLTLTPVGATRRFLITFYYDGAAYLIQASDQFEE